MLPGVKKLEFFMSATAKAIAFRIFTLCCIGYYLCELRAC
ncbi:hypothetical protein BMETH_2627_0 [methanotrophic bacterial endosymbiont of Bathymodiolus sp.]|nr:hypothetical protein BMETH_2627_0 [methanotrophic bacterial endosymbiont of Bathymodiolus sp.]